MRATWSVQDLPRASILRLRRSKAAAAKRAGPCRGRLGGIRKSSPARSRAAPFVGTQLLLGAGAITVLVLVAYFGNGTRARARPTSRRPVVATCPSC